MGISSESGFTADAHEATDEKVLRAHVDSLFRQPATLIPGGEFTGAAAACFAGMIAGSTALLLCGALILVSGAIRWGVQIYYQRQEAPLASEADVASWMRAYSILSWTSSGMVGLFGWLGTLTDITGVQLLAACVVLAATATTGRSGAEPRLVLGQCALLLFPLAAAWLVMQDTVFAVLALLAIAYFALQFRIARSIHDLTFGSLAAAARTTALVERLEQKNNQLEEQDALLRAQTLRFDAALSNMAQGLAMFDADLRMLVCNKRYIEVYGFDPDVIKPGVTLRDITEHFINRGNSNADPEVYYERQRMQLTRNEPLVFSRQLGDGRTIEVNYRPMQGGGYVVTTEDVTVQRQANDRIAHMASHDPLTDLINRAELPQRLGKALSDAESSGGELAVLCLDLDRFKGVNDSLGHPTGDALLQAVAGRLRKLVRPRDTVARLGGDEFVCIVGGLETRDNVAKLAARVIEALTRPFEVNGHNVQIGCSIGVAMAPHDGLDPDQLLRHADVALYRAKSEGRGRFVFFGPDMERVMRERRELEADLRAGVGRGEFELHYQPLVKVGTREVVGCEALMRWAHPTRGLMMPQDFIPLAEECGLIGPLGDWAIRHACNVATQWPDHIKIAVNVSPLQFRSDALLHTVVSALAQSGLDPVRLELEITEAVLLRDSEETLATLNKLRDLGVRIVMDDFGTGYSSLSYLRVFPFDKIKIDRSFVRDDAGRGDCHAIIEAVTNLATGLGMTTTVEGIESEEQMSAVLDRGCTEAQGYLFSHPLPIEELRGVLGQSDRRAA
ncbi:putative bifunctional diguanylate cyclase/phosphodiesterase [Allosphingosinicella indica]|uniref:Diguanylate cyclase (GGDEF) domain-containing protein n=1 Tax=Allosphingosinicella indica TaxID=941907 RepID=A0A1X7G038_9SPHN|nr:EAL domain-containing protein [Allosphingosinicella indica]SMF61728.1 diguanylate cyclase (GGDEF) domain-containing protein [Allosphingosinicella indica]